jgi:hypothetical protein
VTIDRLLTHQRAELGRAEMFRAWSLGLKLVVASLAAISVVFNDGSHLLVLAALGAVVLSVWLVCDGYYRRHRGAGDQARRLLLVTSGLGEGVGEIHVIQTGFTAPVAKLQPMSIDAYFASTAAPGPLRLAEMLDESAFFTAELQRRSGETMLLAFFVGMVAVIVGWLAFAPHLDGSVRVAAARVLLAFGVFLLSSDVLGAAFAHRRAGSVMEAIRFRISAARGRGFPLGDVLQAMADYNAAVEGAPLPLPGVYASRRVELDRTWSEYKQETGIGATSTAEAASPTP